MRGRLTRRSLNLRTWPPTLALALLAATVPACSQLAPQVPGTGQKIPAASVALDRVHLTLVLPGGADASAAGARFEAQGRRTAAILPARRYRVEIRGHDLPGPVTAEATGAIDAATLEIANVPPGTNRLITLQALDDGGADIAGASWAAVASLVSTRNRVTLSAASTAAGRVWARWLDIGESALASGQDPAAVQRKLIQVKDAGNLPHVAFVDAAKWADAAAAADATEVGAAGFSIAPAAVDVTVAGAPAAVPADIWVDDPASPLQSGVSRLTSQSGRYRVAPVLPGTWTVRASVPGLGTVSKTVTLTAGATMDVALAFDGWKAGPALPVPLGNASAATDGRYIYLVGGVTDEYTTTGGVRTAGIATDSCWFLDSAAPNPAWQALPSLPAAREGAAVGISGGKLIVVGGMSGSTEFLDAYGLNLSNPQAWSQLSSPQSLKANCEDSLCDPALPIGTFDDAGALTLLWSVFDERKAAPWALGHSHRWNPASQVWVRDPADVPPIRTPRRRAGVGSVGDLVVVAGGDAQAVREGSAWRGSLSPSLAVVEVFDKATRKWSSWPDLPTPRSELAATGAGASLYAVGGVDFQDYALDVVERFDLTSRAWYPAPALAEPRSAFPLVYAGGKLWAIGGSPARRLNRYDIGWPGSALALKSVETLAVGGAQ